MPMYWTLDISRFIIVTSLTYALWPHNSLATSSRYQERVRQSPTLLAICEERDQSPVHPPCKTSVMPNVFPSHDIIYISYELTTIHMPTSPMSVHYCDVKWAPRHLNSPASRLLLAVCSCWHQRKHQSSSLLALCEGNPQVTGGFPHKGPALRNTVPCQGVIMFWEVKVRPTIRLCCCVVFSLIAYLELHHNRSPIEYIEFPLIPPPLLSRVIVYLHKTKTCSFYVYRHHMCNGVVFWQIRMTPTYGKNTCDKRPVARSPLCCTNPNSQNRQLCNNAFSVNR